MDYKQYLFLDLSWGISGDMLVAALADLGVDFSPAICQLEKALNLKINLKDYSRNHIKGKRLEIDIFSSSKSRKVKDLISLLHTLHFSSSLKKKVEKALLKLAQIEAKIHNLPLEDVHLHELGGEDTLIDLILAFYGIESLNLDKIVATPMPWLKGEVDIAHGVLPLPAPATLKLLKGKPIGARVLNFEAITPTGALLIDALVQEFADGPQGILVASGLGFGDKEKGFNGLRIFLLQKKEDLEEEVYVLESNLDHLSGEEVGTIFKAFLEAGALDVIFLPGIMKKNRPGGLLQVLVPKERLHALTELFFELTFTLGIRINLSKRVLLPRFKKEVKTSLGKISLKCFEFKGQRKWRIEAEDILQLAYAKGLSFLECKKRLEQEINLFFFNKDMGR